MTNQTESSVLSCFEDVSFTKYCGYVYGITTFITILLFTFLGLVVFKCLKKSTVEVLCTEEDTRKNHAEAFKFIVEKCLHFKVKWITSRSKASFKGKYFLLCRVNSRIPEDIGNVLKLTGFENNVDNICLIVAMHRSESGLGKTTVSTLDRKTNNQLHLKEIVNVSYYNEYPLDSESAQKIIAKKYKELLFGKPS